MVNLIQSWFWLDNLRTDIRFAFRQLRQSPGFATTAILTLALGLAAVVTIFGFLDSALIRQLPYPNPSRLVGIFETSPRSSGRMGYSYPNYFDLARSNHVFASIAAYDSRDAFVRSDVGNVHLVHGIGATSKFFRILGVTPIMGRDFAADSDDEDLAAAPSTVILSWASWQNWFAGRADALGKAVVLNGHPYTVIGVLPRSFAFGPTGGAEFWTTLHPFAGDACTLSRGCAAMHVIARLKDGVTPQQALDNVQAIAAEEARQHPDPDRYRGANVLPLSEWILGDIKPVLLALLGGTALLLLIAYVNVTGLLFVRSENRRREFALRGALGAGRGRLVQQFVLEGFVLVALSAILGVFAASLARTMLLKLIPTDMLASMPYLRRRGWNWHVVGFAALLVLIACALLTITPILRLPLANLRAGLAESGFRASGTAWRRVGPRLVVLELATTMVLLAGSGLLGKSLYRLLHEDLGFEPGHLATLSMSALDPKYAHPEQALALQRDVVSRLQNLPGVTGAGIVNDLPISGEGGTQIGIVGKPSLGVNNEVGHLVISPEYLPTLQARLLRGRYFNHHDDIHSALVAMINETLAQRYFPGEDPVGKQFFFHAHDIKLEASQPSFVIVGVVADVKQNELDQPATPVVYTAFEQAPSADFSIAVRTSQNAASMLPVLISTIHQIDPRILTSNAVTMPEIVESSWAAYLHRIAAWLAGTFAALALLLSMVGLYGVIAYSVRRRTREIGVRMAVGATRGSVCELILKEAGGFAVIGLALGFGGSIAAGMLMRSLLFGVRSWDLSILGIVSVMLIIAALLASYLPVRRAASVNPVEALRAE